MIEERTKEEIIKHIKHLIETNVKPAVASHGGVINFISFDEGKLLLELGGACSGCAGSTMTLKMGVENMIKHYVPEVKIVEAQNDPTSTVDPYYTDPSMFNDWEVQEKGEGHNEPNN